MNDLYKALYIQAVDSCVEECSKDGINHAWLWERKYAELIVRECLEQCQISLDDFSYCRIAEHFGMEY